MAAAESVLASTHPVSSPEKDASLTNRDIFKQAVTESSSLNSNICEFKKIAKPYHLSNTRYVVNLFFKAFHSKCKNRCDCSCDRPQVSDTAQSTEYVHQNADFFESIIAVFVQVPQEKVQMSP
jgi:hypothetical protein